MSALALALSDTNHTATTSNLNLLKGDKWDTWAKDIGYNGDMTYSGADQPVSMRDLIESAVAGFYQAISNGQTLQINYSAGKDSETILGLALLALVRAKRQGMNQSKHHFVVHSDTGIENPVIRNLADRKLAKLAEFIEQEDLPLTILIARPGYSSSWAGRVIGGRGLPTSVNSSHRQCSQELKAAPINKAIRNYLKEASKSVKENIVMVLGSRDDEGIARSNNIAKRAGRSSEVVCVGGKYEYYPIREWSEVNVWEFLMSMGASPNHALPSYMADLKETASTYKDASGECIWSPSAKKQGSACGSRFGCSVCLVSVNDKSMNNLLQSDPEKYGHMDGLNRLQRYLINIQWDWSKRHNVGRTIYAGGFVRIQPDVYGPDLTAKLLHICCSLDFTEQQRADRVARDIEKGALENNEHNQGMAKPQFRLITIETLMFIEWLWALHHFQDKPFQAMAIYHKVWTDGNLDLLEQEQSMEPAPKTPRPKPYWAKIGAWYDNQSMFGALADHTTEMVEFEPTENIDFKKINTKAGPRRVVHFQEDSEVTINSEAAEFALFEDYPRLRESVEDGTYSPSYAATYLLRLGAISLAKGMASKSDEMLARGQRYHHLGLTGTQSIEEIVSRTDLTVMNNHDYLKLTGRRMKANVKKVVWWCRLHTIIEHNLANKTPLGIIIESALLTEGFTDEMDSYNNHLRQCNEATSQLLDAFAHYCMKLDKTTTTRGYLRYAIRQLKVTLSAVPDSISHGLIESVVSELMAASWDYPSVTAWRNTDLEQSEQYRNKIVRWLESNPKYKKHGQRKEIQLSIEY